MNSSQGKQFLLKEAQKTEALSPPMTFVPWVTINKVINIKE
jgi:hypothetical protein